MSYFHGLTKFALSVATAVAISSCASSPPAKHEAAAQAMKEPQEAVAGRTAQNPPQVPERQDKREFSPASENISPLKTKKISITARNSPLRDVIYTVAESASLNVIMEKGVDPETPVTIALKNMSAEEVLETVLASVDYFYTIEGNILTIKLTDTRIFEFGQPSVIQEYSVEVGGDMLGGAKSGSSGVSGSVVQKVQSDKDSFKFWDAMEKTIGTMLGKGSPQGSAPSYSVNRMTGTIVVTAPKGDLERVERYISAVRKILKRQVLVEARIVEVQLSDSLKYGIDWTFLGGDWNGVGSAGFGTTGFTNTLNNLPKFNFALAGGDFTALLQALQQQGNVNVLSNPRVNIMNGQTAYLSVGRKTDYISKVETTSTGTATTVPTVTFTVETTSVLSGIVFGIVPYINDREDGEITMTISPIISDLVRLDSKSVGTSEGNSVEISLPTIDLRELSTTVQVRDGQMVVIGGLIQNKESLRDNNVPFLSAIPLIGPLFTNRDMVNEKTELIIILKPVVAPEA
ncbi:MAG: pilus (MSHA type) biogenesis protein MshL [Deltaproteobacteria bacterium]|nr:pilus (MSHA type) biogenesis protein MshL [Deltaproteobacteria bacterium]